MAGPYYVRSTDGVDTDDGLTWATAKATLAGALAIANPGERIWVSQNHAETTGSANITLASPGTAAAPVEILCGNDAAQPPTTKASSAQISTTSNFSINFSGHAYCYGIIFQASASTNTGSLSWLGTTSWWWKLEACNLIIRGTSGSNRINVGSANASHVDHELELQDCNIQFAAGTHAINCGAVFTMRGGSILGSGVAPTGGLVKTVAGNPPTARFLGVDLTNLGANALLGIPSSTTNAPGGFVKYENCRLGAIIPLASLVVGSFNGPGNLELIVDNCYLDGSVPYPMQRTRYQGTVSQDNTVVRTSGASDGATPVSWKMSSGAGATYHHPLASPDIPAVVVGTGASQTFTVEILTDNVTLTDKMIWLEIEYRDTALPPRSLFALDRADILATAVAQTTSAVVWTTTGVATPIKQKLVVAATLPAGVIAWVRARVLVGSPTINAWVDPLLQVA